MNFYTHLGFILTSPFLFLLLKFLIEDIIKLYKTDRQELLIRLIIVLFVVGLIILAISIMIDLTEIIIQSTSFHS